MAINFLSYLNHHKLTLLLLITCLCSAAILYGRSLGAPFIFDDQQNIVYNPYIQADHLSWEAIKAATIAYRGTFGRPVATISFALNYLVTGLSPSGFKAVNLVIHLLCGIALFAMTALLLRTASENNLLHITPTEQTLAAALTSALWILHPLHVSTVLYAVQRMSMLAALFSIIGLYCYILMRRQHLDGKSGLLALIFLIINGLLAVFSKENGALLLPMCGVLELGLFRLRAQKFITRRIITNFWWGLLIATSIIILLTLPQIIEWLPRTYVNREFTLFERVLTQPRVLILYLRLLFFPDIGAMSLYHDDLEISHDWFSPLDTLPATISILMMLAFAVIGLASRYRLAAIGVCIFFVGHAIESTVIALEMVFEHRNYLPSSGLFLAIAVSWIEMFKGRQRNILIVLVLFSLALLTAQRTQIFSDVLDHISFSLKNHPHSLRTQLWAGDTFLAVGNLVTEDKTRWVDYAIKHYRIASKLDVNDVIGLLQIIELNAQLKRELNTADFAEVARRLNELTVRPGTIIAVKDFVDHIVSETNPFPFTDAIRLAELLLENPRCDGRGRAVILNSLATAVVEINNDFEAGIKYSHEATQLEPEDPSIWITYAVILLKAQRFADAKQATLNALSVDKGPFQKGLKRLLSDIETAQAEKINKNQ